MNFPVSSVRSRLVETCQDAKVDAGAPVFLSAVLEHVVRQMLGVAHGNCVKDAADEPTGAGQKSITPRNIVDAVRSNEDLRHLMQGLSKKVDISNLHGSVLSVCGNFGAGKTSCAEGVAHAATERQCGAKVFGCNVDADLLRACSSNVNKYAFALHMQHVTTCFNQMNQCVQWRNFLQPTSCGHSDSRSAALPTDRFPLCILANNPLSILAGMMQSYARGHVDDGDISLFMDFYVRQTRLLGSELGKIALKLPQRAGGSDRGSSSSAATSGGSGGSRSAGSTSGDRVASGSKMAAQGDIGDSDGSGTGNGGAFGRSGFRGESCGGSNKKHRTVLVFLDSSPAMCYQRLLMRPSYSDGSVPQSKPESETQAGLQLPLSYLEGIDNFLFELVVRQCAQCDRSCNCQGSCGGGGESGRQNGGASNEDVVIIPWDELEHSQQAALKSRSLLPSADDATDLLSIVSSSLSTMKRQQHHACACNTGSSSMSLKKTKSQAVPGSAGGSLDGHSARVQTVVESEYARVRFLKFPDVKTAAENLSFEAAEIWQPDYDDVYPPPVSEDPLVKPGTVEICKQLQEVMSGQPWLNDARRSSQMPPNESSLSSHAVPPVASKANGQRLKWPQRRDLLYTSQKALDLGFQCLPFGNQESDEDADGPAAKDDSEPAGGGAAASPRKRKTSNMEAADKPIARQHRVFIHCQFWLNKTNAFKRVIMRHLARNDQIVFFSTADQQDDAEEEDDAATILSSWLATQI
jgi:hypothetical protein